MDLEKHTMASTGKSARVKGHSFERKVAREFRELGFPNARRHLEYQAEEASHGQDISGTYPFLVQCKATKQYAPITAIHQIADQKDQYKILVTKGDNLEPMAVMAWSDLKEILSKLKIENII